MMVASSTAGPDVVIVFVGDGALWCLSLSPCLCLRVPCTESYLGDRGDETPLTLSLKLKLKSKPKSKPQWKLEKEDGCHIWLYFWPARAARQVIHPLGATPAY